MMDLCWVMCALSCVFGLCLAFMPMIDPQFDDNNPKLVKKVFLAFFAMSSGPVGMNIAIEMKANGMVFHSIEHIVPLFIHSSPLITAWCLRWNLKAFIAAYPVFSSLSELSFDVTFIEYVTPAIMMYAIWW